MRGIVSRSRIGGRDGWMRGGKIFGMHCEGSGIES